MNTLDLSKDDPVKLKPCAFCGSEKVKTETGGPYFVYCIKCRASGPVFGNRLGAESHWNRRHEEQPSEFERCMK